MAAETPSPIPEAVPAVVAGGAAVMAASRINAAQGAMNTAGTSLSGIPTAAPGILGTVVQGGLLAAGLGIMYKGIKMIVGGKAPWEK